MNEDRRDLFSEATEPSKVSDPDPTSVLRSLAAKLEELNNLGIVRQLAGEVVQRHIAADQRTRYYSAIREVRLRHGLAALSPELFFEAADDALHSDLSLVQARIGILPGTMNPPHNGHISAALAAIVAFRLNAVILAPGATVPDKPDSPFFALRAQMVEVAANSDWARGWVQTTSVRQDAVDMFFSDRFDREFGFDDSGTRRRSMMDMAAFIWLFRSNPNVNWVYLVGSDKVANYGRNQEKALVVGTLGNPKAKAEVAYYPRSAHDIDVVRDIQPYPWLLAKWREGLFKQAPIKSCDVSGFAVRAAIARRSSDPESLDLSHYLPSGVLNFVINNKDLLAQYAREGRSI